MRRAAGALLAAGALILVALATPPAGCRSPQRAPPPAPGPSASSPLGASFDFAGPRSLLTVRGAALHQQATLMLWLDDAARPLPVQELRIDALPGGGLQLHAPVRFGLDTAAVRIDMIPAEGQLLLELHVDRASMVAHALRLRLELEAPASSFAAGHGELGDLGRYQAATLTMQAHAEAAMFGIGAAVGELGIERFAYPSAIAEAIGLAVESPGVALEKAGDSARLQLAVGRPSEVLAALFGARGQEPQRVHGQVKGASAGAAVYATDERGAPQARTLVRSDGAFELHVPKECSRFFAESRGAGLGADNMAARTSTTTRFEPGVAWPLLLSLEASGTCMVQVFDGASQQPLTARLIVRGVDGTPDPWFGPDYRGSGAGPVADLRDGVGELELPAGHYKVQATHGPLYSIDEVLLQVLPSTRSRVILRPRRVVPGLGLLSADLHVHARPSYDSPVQAEDRVLSLVAAGVDFAVPTEHNVVGDYDSALSFTGQQDRLRYVPGVEVTTFAPKLGHFGVFPYPPEEKVPPYRGTSLAALFAFVRKDPQRILIVHHPFLGSGMGYFDREPRVFPARRRFGNVPLGFDAIELLNGYETLDANRLEQTLEAWLGLLNAGHHAVGVGSSDSHRILYGWAGYPRSMIRVQNAGVPELATLQLPHLLASLRAGRVQATTGPVVELTVQGASPGDTVKVSGKTLAVHLAVHAAPWIDVTRVDVLLGGRIATSIPVQPSPLRVGPESGSDDEVLARSVRLVRDLELQAPARPSYVLVVVRGEKSLEWALPATALPPIAITNPVWLR